MVNQIIHLIKNIYIVIGRNI